MSVCSSLSILHHFWKVLLFQGAVDHSAIDLVWAQLPCMAPEVAFSPARVRQRVLQLTGMKCVNEAFTSTHSWSERVSREQGRTLLNLFVTLQATGNERANTSPPSWLLHKPLICEHLQLDCPVVTGRRGVRILPTADLSTFVWS